MLRRSLAAAILLVFGGVILAGEYRGLVTKCEDGKCTVKVFKKGEEPKEMTFKVSKDVKITRAGKKGAEPKELSADQFKELVKKGTKVKDKQIDGVRATVETRGDGDAEEVVAIKVGGGRRPKKSE